MFYSKFDNRKYESLYEYHVNYKPTKKEIITHNISMFRNNVVEEFINVGNFVYDAFIFFNEAIAFEHIITKEDFGENLNHLYDWIAESYYFDGYKYDNDDVTYRQEILDEIEFADNFKEKREIAKRYLKTRKFDTLRMDGVLDNMLHCYFDFKHLLPTEKEFYYSFKDIDDLNNQKRFLTMDMIYDRLKEIQYNRLKEVRK